MVGTFALLIRATGLATASRNEGRSALRLLAIASHIRAQQRNSESLLPMPHPLPALIVVDVQRAFDEWEAAGKRRNNPDAVARIVDLLAAFRTSGAPIFHIRHEGTKPNSTFLPSRTGYAVKDEARERPASP